MGFGVGVGWRGDLTLWVTKEGFAGSFSQSGLTEDYPAIKTLGSDCEETVWKDPGSCWGFMRMSRGDDNDNEETQMAGSSGGWWRPLRFARPSEVDAGC